MFPLKLGNRIVYAASSGLVLSLQAASGKAVVVDGRTGKFSSKFRIDGIGSKSSWRAPIRASR